MNRSLKAPKRIGVFPGTDHSSAEASFSHFLSKSRSPRKNSENEKSEVFIDWLARWLTELRKSETFRFFVR